MKFPMPLLPFRCREDSPMKKLFRTMELREQFFPAWLRAWASSSRCIPRSRRDPDLARQACKKRCLVKLIHVALKQRLYWTCRKSTNTIIRLEFLLSCCMMINKKITYEDCSHNNITISNGCTIWHFFGLFNQNVLYGSFKVGNAQTYRGLQ